MTADAGITPERNSNNLEKVTDAGRLDIAFQPSGTKGYNDLKEKAVCFEVFGLTLFASNLNDIIRSKKAAGRPQDLQDIIILRDILNRK